MNLRGFYRNCLVRWMAGAAEELGVALGMEEAKALVYGRHYDQWKARHQAEASEAQKAAFTGSFKTHG